MKFYDKLVVIDAKNNKATNLSIAAGTLKLLSFLLVIGAILLTLGHLLHRPAPGCRNGPCADNMVPSRRA